MSDPTGCGCARACSTRQYCDNCDLLIGLDGYHLLDVEERGEHLVVTIESPPGPLGVPVVWCRRREPRPPDTHRDRRAMFRAAGAAAVAQAHRDLPRNGVSDQDIHRTRRSRCRAAGAVVDAGVLVGDSPDPPGDASVQGVARRLGTSWRTV